MCDVFSRLFQDSTEPRSSKLHHFYQDNQRRENENIKILQNNHKLSTNPVVLEENNPFDIQKVDLCKKLNNKQNQIETRKLSQSLPRNINRNEFFSSSLNLIKNKKKANDNFHTPRKVATTDIIDNQLKFNLNKTTNSSAFSYLQKQNNLALTAPKIQPQLQIRHLDYSIDNLNYQTSRSQKSSSHIHLPPSNTSSRSLKKMKIKMKNGRFISKSEIDNEKDTDDINIDPQKFKKQITHLEKKINENREKMRFGLGDEKDDDQAKSNTIKSNAIKSNAIKSNAIKRETTNQITPKLRKTSRSMTPNLVQSKKISTTPRSVFLTDKIKLVSDSPKINISLDQNNSNDYSNQDEHFDLCENLNLRLNSTLSKNLKNRVDLDDDSHISENIDFDDHFKKEKRQQFGKQFDFLFGNDELINNKGCLDEQSKNEDRDLIMIDQKFWNLHLANMIPTEENDDDAELSKENDQKNINSLRKNVEDPIIIETSLNSPLEESASNAISTTLFSWELAGFANYLSDMI